MRLEKFSEKACKKIDLDTALVNEHLKTLEEMVGIDSRSFGVNEFEGDRTVPTDMEEILECAKNYLIKVGLPKVWVNSSGKKHPFPILMGEIFIGDDKPTLLFYAHLDKQPYMDNEKFEKWGGTPPTELRWNEDRSRAYGRGAADDLSGVVSIGMAIDALIQTIDDCEDDSLKLPCNIKVIFETEEESGSHSLIEQIHENKNFFSCIDCVVITDVVNPAQGVPGLTTSLRGIIQMEIGVTKTSEKTSIDEQTALYKLLSKLIHDDHSLAIGEISRSDQPVTDEERKGYSFVPTSVEALRQMAGVLPETRLSVPEDIASILIAQLRTSFVNARPGHRISGSVILGTAGARLSFPGIKDPYNLAKQIDSILKDKNPFKLKLNLNIVSKSPSTIDLILQSASKDPHSGVNGGPVPIPEIQLACMIDYLISDDGALHPGLQKLSLDSRIEVRSLFVDQGLHPRLFDDPAAKSLVELRLAPGNKDKPSIEKLKRYLLENKVPGFELKINEDKGASPWMTTISHPVFPLMLESLQKGFEKKPCLYGCGGTIPFVEKLMQALGNVQPLCLGAYDPDAKMHEPGESLSMPDLLGCTRSIIHLVSRAQEVYGSAENN